MKVVRYAAVAFAALLVLTCVLFVWLAWYGHRENPRQSTEPASPIVVFAGSAVAGADVLLTKYEEHKAVVANVAAATSVGQAMLDRIGMPSAAELQATESDPKFAPEGGLSAFVDKMLQQKNITLSADNRQKLIDAHRLLTWRAARLDRDSAMLRDEESSAANTQAMLAFDRVTQDVMDAAQYEAATGYAKGDGEAFIAAMFAPVTDPLLVFPTIPNGYPEITTAEALYAEIPRELVAQVIGIDREWNKSTGRIQGMTGLDKVASDALFAQEGAVYAAQIMQILTPRQVDILYGGLGYRKKYFDAYTDAYRAEWRAQQKSDDNDD